MERNKENNKNKKIIAEYLWLDANNHLRSKQRTIQISLTEIECMNNAKKSGNCDKLILHLPIWSYDGSSTGQAPTNKSELLLKPVKIIKHPKQTSSMPKILVLCEVYSDNVTPHSTNQRAICKSMYVNHKQTFNKEAWFGLEQEFFFFDKHTKKPYMWDTKKTLNPEQGEYYCGLNRCFPKERIIMDSLYSICLDLGIPIHGINQEVAPSQWEYQIGPCIAPDIADYMIFAKYILFMLCEEHELYAVFNPKPIKGGEWNGSGCHVNISTNETRSNFECELYKSKLNAGNMDISYNSTPALNKVYDIINEMEKDHNEFIIVCGERNKKRLSGTCETEQHDKFTYGIGTRNTSVRIPIQVQKDGYGYLEDRRPGSDIDYYRILTKYAEYL